jgi:hypothetical protein
MVKVFWSPSRWYTMNRGFPCSTHPTTDSKQFEGMESHDGRTPDPSGWCALVWTGRDPMGIMSDSHKQG